MKVGDLVRIKRLSRHVPMNTPGLVLENVKTLGTPKKGEVAESIWRVQLLYNGPMREGRYLCRDLESLNESR